jgi:peroxiredoxin Q/BCP
MSSDSLQAGDPAPDFTLPDQHGRVRSLADYRGRWLVLYFYPRDNTPGCTAEACGFRDRKDELHTLGAEVVGVSTDDAGRHSRFAHRHDLGFTLLADTDGAVARRYGALWRLGPLRLARRHSFLIDPNGRIARVYRKVHASGHGIEIAADLRDVTTKAAT